MSVTHNRLHRVNQHQLVVCDLALGDVVVVSGEGHSIVATGDCLGWRVAVVLLLRGDLLISWVVHHLIFLICFQEF